MENKTVVRLDALREDDFYRMHSTANGAGWCFCTAWWVPTWEGWGERTAEQNRQLRENLFRRDEWDGYLLYVSEIVAGWCQVGRRDRLVKLVRQFDLTPDPTSWAITCFLIAPPYRRQGLAAFFLDDVLHDLGRRGVRRVEAFPKHGADLEEDDLWNGPEAMFLRAGFKVARQDPRRPVLALESLPAGDDR